jgi:transposase
MDAIIQPDQRASTRGSYRRHSDEFNLAVVTQSLLPDASVSRIALEYNINANQMFAWRKRCKRNATLAITHIFQTRD